jgi:hypothetical protein
MDARSVQAELRVRVDCPEQVLAGLAGSVAPKGDRFAQAEPPGPVGCSEQAPRGLAGSVAPKDDRFAQAERPVRAGCLVPVDSVAGGCSLDWLRGAHFALAVGLAAQRLQDDCLHPAGLRVAGFRPDGR